MTWSKNIYDKDTTKPQGEDAPPFRSSCDEIKARVLYIRKQEVFLYSEAATWPPSRPPVTLGPCLVGSFDRYEI